jgi:D-glycero-beta-D-manno-heptose 1-phosphate adenylyltransferase
MAPILSHEDLLRLISEWKASGLVTGFTCGAFDLLHAGHADYLHRARMLCDRLIVAVNSDESIRSYKNPQRPIVNEQHRLQLVACLASSDAVTLMPDLRPARLLKLLEPDLYIKGGDYSVEKLKSASIVESYGGKCVVIPVVHDISSTDLIHRIQQLNLYAGSSRAIRTTKPVRLVMLDRDGTLIENVPFVKEPSSVKLLPGVAEGLRALQDEGFTLVIVTNQQGLGLGYFDYNQFVAVNSEMLRQLSKAGVSIARIYYCGHSLADHCECRKPGAKLLKGAMAYFDARPEDCLVIGDSHSDMQAAERAGCKGLLSGPASGLDFRDVVEIILHERASLSAN